MAKARRAWDEERRRAVYAQRGRRRQHHIIAIAWQLSTGELVEAIVKALHGVRPDRVGRQ